MRVYYRQTCRKTGLTRMMTRRIEWEKIKIDGGSFESAGVFDVNNDGVLDIVCGGYWYEGPDWKKHKICDVPIEGEYYDDFSTIPLDVNGDGYLDIITGGWFGQRLVWRENPAGSPIEWKTHDIDMCGSIETTRAWDIDNDGELEICPNTPGNPLVFYKLIRDANGRGTGKFMKGVISERPAGHGLGLGDILGNGNSALITPDGWFEAPENPLEQQWIFHQEFSLGSASVPILVADINEDDVPEIVVGQAHGYGLDYYTQSRASSCAERVWTKHPIDPFFSQYHTLEWVDIDGDGRNELVTGNRYRAHCGTEAGETDIVGLYYFKWNGESFTKNVIDHGSVPFHSGTGIFFTVIDIDGDGRLDIIAPGKEGLYLFKNRGTETVGLK